MEESDASLSVSDSVSTLIDGAEASDSGYAAGRSSGCEDEAYMETFLWLAKPIMPMTHTVLFQST